MRLKYIAPKDPHLKRLETLLKINIDPKDFHLKRIENLLKRGFEWKINIKKPKIETAPESDVIHFITEVRKLLEITNSKSFPFLKFFCDWALHSSIDRSNIPLKIFKKITNTIIYGPNNVLQWVRPLESITFVEFRKDLGKFLKEHNLPTELTRKNRTWRQFLEGYIFLIVDSPLMLNSNKPHQKKLLKTRRKWGINSKVSILVLRIMPPFDTRPSRSGAWCGVPSLLWYVIFDNGYSIPIPCVFYSLRTNEAELELWHGLVTIGKNAKLS
jgi:hypothetical protein